MRSFWSGYIIGILCVVGCASIFPYKYYATSMPDSCYQEGTLLGKPGSSGWPDISLKTCEPDPNPSPLPSGSPKPILLKCITMQVDEFYGLQADYEKCQSDLSKCENGPAPSK